MTVSIHIVKNHGVTYADGTFVAWADFLIDEPAFVMPKDSERIEYIPGERLSYFKDGSQFGDAAFEGLVDRRWEDGDRFITRKDEYVANAIARIPPPPPPPDPQPENTMITEAKIAIDNFIIDPLADAKVKAVLVALRAAL